MLTFARRRSRVVVRASSFARLQVELAELARALHIDQEDSDDGDAATASTSAGADAVATAGAGAASPPSMIGSIAPAFRRLRAELAKLRATKADREDVGGAEQRLSALAHDLSETGQMLGSKLPELESADDDLRMLCAEVRAAGSGGGGGRRARTVVCPSDSAERERRRRSAGRSVVVTLPSENGAGLSPERRAIGTSTNEI